MAKYLVVVATTVYNELVIDADSRLEAHDKAMETDVDFSEGDVFESPYIETVEELDA